MKHPLDTVLRLNAAAHRDGAAAAVLQFENIGTQAQYREPYDVTARYVHSGDSVLDWGCGNGHFSLYLESLGAQVTGYSFEPKPSSMSRSGTFRFVPGSTDDPRSLPFADASFDAVVGVGVLEHVWETGGDEAASLAELSRVLKPGGVLLTYHLPNRSGWIEKVVSGLRLSKHFHYRKFDEAEIRRLWRDAHFDVIELGRYNALPRSELRRLPALVRHSVAFTRLYNAADDALLAVAPSIATNFWIAARKQAGA